MLRTDRSQIVFFAVVALVLRIGLYLAFPGRVHPDETFQYIEQANRLLGRPGIVPWEFVMGVRSWALPAIVAGVLRVARQLSADPLFAIQMVGVVFALPSLVGVVLGYRWGEAKGGRAAAIACACLNATAVDLVYLAPHPLPDTVAAPLLLGGLYVADLHGDAPSRRRFATAGLLFGCCLAFRVQLAPAIALGMLLLGGRQPRDRLIPLCLGAAVPLALSGLLDWATWGRPFQSIWLYFWVNSIHGAADRFGTAPWYHYLAYLLNGWAPLFLPVLGLAVLGARRAPVPGAVALAIVGTFSLVGHKEYRFLYPALPLIMTLVGLGSADVAGFAASRLGGRPIEARSLGCMLALFWAGASALFGAFGPARVYWPHGTAIIESMRIVNGDPVACGIAMSPANRWSAGGGYSALRPGIQFFGFRTDADRRQTEAFNYIYSVTEMDFTPYGFTRVRCWEGQPVCLWHRPGGCDPAPGRPVEVTRTPG
jgi:hypothetical protein